MSKTDQTVNASNASPGDREQDQTKSCVCCEESESFDNCVQCDECHGWWHYTCAEETASVKDRSFVCAHCVPLSVCSQTTTSSVRAARLALKKQQLEEQQAMEQRHLTEKYKLLEEELKEAEETGSNRSRISLGISKKSSLEKVKQWQQKCADQSEGARGYTLAKQSADPVAVPQIVQIGPHDEKKADGSETDAVLAKQQSKVVANEPTFGAQAAVQQQPNIIVTDGRQECSFGSPPWNSTARPFSRRDANVVQRNQQQKSGAIPKTTAKLQEVALQPGKPDPKVSPVAPEGKPLHNPINNTPAHPLYENSLQHIVKQFGSLAPSATVSSFDASMHPLATNILPSFGTSVGIPPPANPILSSGLAPPPAGLPNISHPPTANPISFGLVPPHLRLPNVGPPPQANPVLSIGSVSAPLGLSLVNQFTPSPSQLAARQVMSRDLPTFSGDPADWPIFISSFMNSSLACGYNSAENLARLQRCLKGGAYESVKSRLLLPESVPQVIDTLRLLYGRPELLISALLQKVRSVPAPKAEKLETIIDFGMAVRSLCDHLEAAGQQEHLCNPTLLMELVEKLPAHTKMQWADHIQRHAVVNLKVFGDFMLGVVTSISRVTMYVGGGNSQQKSKHKGAVNAHTSEAETVRETVREKERTCVCCKKPGHRLSECTAFKSYTVDNRWKFTQNNGLCRSCLNAHGRRSCRNATQCVYEGCQFRHHPLLHSNRHNNNGRSTPGMVTVQNHTHRQFKQILLFRIIPVIISGPRATIETFAFLDDGSDLSLIESDLIEQLGIEGWKNPLCLKWTGNVTRVESESKQVRIMISGTGGQQQFALNDVRTVKALTLPEQSLDYGEISQRYRYLQGLPIVGYEKAVPRLLIGVNNARLTVPLQIREGGQSEPIAVKTRLGWCLFGGRGKETPHSLNFHTCECSSDQDLHNAVKDYFAMENIGVTSSVVLESEEDKRAKTIMEQTTARVGEQFETGLLWKYNDIEFPDNYSMAVKRFECLERRMSREPELAANLKNQIAEYQLKGYAHIATKEELAQADPKRVWYLPLGVVTNPRKPGKVRLIWDAAAKVDGISLNSMLLKGPDQLTSLPAVLSRFRQFKVAVSADIKDQIVTHSASCSEATRQIP
ncbi:uncharacterized protein LOC134206384 [Armigeres subalbatus]|uniref:uncharacterized protein LOC134206384 n=1 Tax=Armigeres subalbatus TaxID=124917 RepID=UPI002ED18DC1